MALLIKIIIRFRFIVTTRVRAQQQIQQALDDYLKWGSQLNPELGRKPHPVPLMPGVDASMRNWSYYMILEHNVIVNRSICEIIRGLATGKPIKRMIRDTKNDVMPSADPGPEQIPAFEQSVRDYLEFLPDLGNLRRTKKERHPIFGMLTAHGWHCMFAFHLQLHLNQIKKGYADA